MRDTFEKATAESVIGPFKTELDRNPARRSLPTAVPGEGVDDLEVAACGWVSGFNEEGSHGELDDLHAGQVEVEYRHPSQPTTAPEATGRPGYRGTQTHPCDNGPVKGSVGNVSTPPVPSRAHRVWFRYRRRIPGIAIIALGVAAVAWTGVRSSSDEPPATSETAVLLLLSGVLQVGGGVVFGRVGRVDSQKARSSVRRVVTIGVAARDLRVLLSEVKQEPDDQGRVIAIAEHSLKMITGQLEDALRDWGDVYEEALDDLLEKHESSAS